MSTRAYSQLRWGTNLENIVTVRHLRDMLTDRRAREGSEFLKLPSGGRSAWVVGRDYTIQCALRWIPYGDADPTPWSGPLGIQSFLDWMRDGNSCRFVPDINYPLAYMDGCYLDDPLEGGGNLDELIRRTQQLTLAHPTIDFGLMMRGLLLDYAPQDDYTRLLPLPLFSRASTGLFLNANTLFESAATNALRDRHYVGGVRSVLLEGARTNLVVQSDDLRAASGWTVSGGMTVTQNYDTVGTVALSRVESVTGNNVQRTVTLTGNAVKAFSLIVEWDGVAGTSVHSFRDDTAGTMKATVTVTWAADGSATAAASVGTLLAFVALGSGTLAATNDKLAPRYRIIARTTSCTAANTHSVYAVNGGTVTSVRVGAVQVENAATPSSVITTTTTTVTRALDNLRFPFSPVPQVMWLYVKFVELGTLADAGAPFLLSINTTTGNPALYIDTSGGAFRAVHNNGGAGVTSTAGASPAYGDTVELLVLVSSTGTVQLIQSINGAAATTASASAALALPPTWGATPYLSLGHIGGGNQAHAAFHQVRSGPGNAINTMALARAA